MKRNIITGSIVVLVVLVGILLGCAYYLSGENTVVVPQIEEGVQRISKEEIGMDRYILEDEIITAMGRECVQVKTDASLTASGVIYACDKKKLTVLTAGHVLDAATGGMITLFDGTELTFELDDIDVLHDVDVAVITIKNNTKYQLGHSGAQAFTNTDTSIGARIWMLESSIYPVCDIVDGIVAGVDLYLSDYDSEMLLVYAKGKLGISGSPIYDEEGFLLGIVSGMNEDGDTLSVVPVETIIKALESDMD